MKRSMVVAIFLLCLSAPLFAQEGCTVADEGRASLPVALPLTAAGEDTLWKVILLSSRWDYDHLLRLAKVSGIIFNAGEERIRGAGLQTLVLDGAGRSISYAWKTGSNVYLEAGSYDTISMEILFPQGPGPATITIETIAVTGSCGW
ncbi:MAG: hypothetical protein CVV53_05395 [Spirochaetae bacterium HGW-Spirochaetae-9]|nr:MAG: hypothetical protein CVV53_05395 [Spirochaetae bacterium HGW-Spirochaetae-9]